VSNFEVFLPKCEVLLLNTPERKDVPGSFCLIVGHKMWLHIVTIVLLATGDLEAGLFSVDKGNLVCGLLHMAFSDN